MEEAIKFATRLILFIMIFLLFGGLPMLFFHPRLLEASAKSISVSPWVDWRAKSPQFFKKLSWSLRMPFMAFALSVSTFLSFRPFVTGNIIFFALPLGAIAGIIYYLKGPE